MSRATRLRQRLRDLVCSVIGHRAEAHAYGDVDFKVCRRCRKVYAVTLINPGSNPTPLSRKQFYDALYRAPLDKTKTAAQWNRDASR